MITTTGNLTACSTISKEHVRTTFTRQTADFRSTKIHQNENLHENQSERKRKRFSVILRSTIFFLSYACEHKCQNQSLVCLLSNDKN